LLSEKSLLIRSELELGTGAAVTVETAKLGMRSGVSAWFADLEKRNGPYIGLVPYGLKRHKVILRFGDFSGATISQIRAASSESVALARALTASITKRAQLSVPGQALSTWQVNDGAFFLEAIVTLVGRIDDDDSVVETCREVITPIMGAMAELIGYDTVSSDEVAESTPLEGRLLESTVIRRERNPRSRLLCIQLEGETCRACKRIPNDEYGVAGRIIEVHHLEPLSLLSTPRAYDPSVDLVALCPNCHRAVHTRRPHPWTVEELEGIIADAANKPR